MSTNRIIVDSVLGRAHTLTQANETRNLKMGKMYAVIASRTNELYDGPFYSLVAASDAASRANELARENGKPAQYFVVEQ